jgi:hypothetical protein
MFELGAALRDARQKRGMSIEEVEQATRMGARQLRALEAERFDVFPSDFYARSFLRGYADYLGLDGSALAAEYRERFEQPNEAPRPPHRRVGRRHLVLAAGVVAAVVAAVLLAWSPGGGRKPASVATPPALGVHARRAVHRAPPPPPRVSAHPAKPRIVLAAARGDCWLLVRGGSATGPLLYQGMLASGRSLVFARRFLYIRAAAPWNLDVRQSGRLRRLTSAGGPVNVLLTPRGLRPD